jgi:hypothetical protein
MKTKPLAGVSFSPRTVGLQILSANWDTIYESRGRIKKMLLAKEVD